MYARDRLFVGGRWVVAESGRRVEVENPATEQPIGYAPDASAADVALAVTAARTAFDDGEWPR
nr:aldehyde dehydrogenase family protein [Micromonospora sp. DSM 115978]